MNQVAAALIEKDGKILIAQRAFEDKLSMLWEFPGGKLEKGESAEECLRREITEELSLEIRPQEHYMDSLYEYENGAVSLAAYKAEVISGDLRLNVHENAKWVSPGELLDYPFAPADRPIALKRVREHIGELAQGLDALTIYRGLLDDSLLGEFLLLLRTIEAGTSCVEDQLKHYGRFCHGLMAWEPFCRGTFFSFPQYALELILYHESPFGRMAERTAFESLPAQCLYAAQRDLALLQQAVTIPPSLIKKLILNAQRMPRSMQGKIKGLPEWDVEHVSPSTPVFQTERDWGDSIRELAAFHKTQGSGNFARYHGFIWERNGSEGKLKGISRPDTVRFSDFIGYETQRRQLIQNTQQLIKGQRANNVLLYGGRGTGKSSSVKALLNEYQDQGLRVIEIPRQYLSDFPQIIRLLEGKPQKFILFIDDLAFEDSEENFTALKALLEGGLENLPDNMAIYATSNRRHLVKERFSDRAGTKAGQDDVHAWDTLQEKLSLADRFGITITYPSPGQEEYLRIVSGLAEKAGIDMPAEELKKEAIRWEMWYNGRSPRTACQFITYLKGMQNQI